MTQKIIKKLEKKLKVYKKDLDEKFKDKIKQLSALTHDQAKYNLLISDLISKMSLDENFEEKEEDAENKDENNKNQKNQENEDQKMRKQKQEGKRNVYRIWCSRP